MVCTYLTLLWISLLESILYLYTCTLYIISNSLTGKFSLIFSGFFRRRKARVACFILFPSLTFPLFLSSSCLPVLFPLPSSPFSFFLPLLFRIEFDDFLYSWQIATINTYLFNDDFMLLVCKSSKIPTNPICFFCWFHNIKLSFSETAKRNSF